MQCAQMMGFVSLLIDLQSVKPDILHSSESPCLNRKETAYSNQCGKLMSVSGSTFVEYAKAAKQGNVRLIVGARGLQSPSVGLEKFSYPNHLPTQYVPKNSIDLRESFITCNY